MPTWRDDDDDDDFEADEYQAEEEYEERLEDEEERGGQEDQDEEGEYQEDLEDENEDEREGQDEEVDYEEDLEDENEYECGGGGGSSKKRRRLSEVAEEKMDDNDIEFYDNPRGGSDEEEEEANHDFIVDSGAEFEDDDETRMRLHPLLTSEDDSADEPLGRRFARYAREDSERRMLERHPRSNHTEYNEGTTDVETSKDNSTNKKRAHLTPMQDDSEVGGSSGVGNELKLMATTFNKFMDFTMEHLKSIRDATIQERNLGARLLKELDKIVGLSEDNVIDAASIILDSTTKTSIFFGMSDERRAYYVKSRILKPSLP